MFHIFLNKIKCINNSAYEQHNQIIRAKMKDEIQIDQNVLKIFKIIVNN